MADNLEKELLKKRRKEFVSALAEYLVSDEAIKSVKLQSGDQEAKLWARIRNATPLFGYYKTTEKAEKELAEWFGWE